MKKNEYIVPDMRVREVFMEQYFLLSGGDTGAASGEDLDVEEGIW